MEQFILKNKNILVTGASSGIGKQVAISIAEAGGKVIISGRNIVRLEECFNELKGDGHKLIVSDITKENEINSLVDELPEISGVVHSAGITEYMPTKFIRQSDIDNLFGINFNAAVLLTSRILKKKRLKNPGSIVFMSSIASKKFYYGGALYSSSKSALETYSRVLALELASKKIRSNCLLPTFVKTPMIANAEKTISSESMENFERISPLGFGEPIDVANATVFLLSDASKWITGTNIPMGGG